MPKELYHITDACNRIIDDLEDEHVKLLLPDIIIWALKAMKQDPSLTYLEAWDLGYEEWIK